MEEQSCPERITFDSGVAFSLGLVLGTLYNTFKGFRGSPDNRWFGVKTTVVNNAPRLGGKIKEQNLKRQPFLKYCRKLCCLGYFVLVV